MKKTKISLAILALAASTILAACGGTTSSTKPTTSAGGVSSGTTEPTPVTSSATSAVVVDHEELKVTKPTKSTYELGEALDLAGLKVEKVSYDADDVELERVTLSEGEYTLSHPGTTVATGLTLDFAGEMPITVTAGDLTASFTITIDSVVTKAIAVTNLPTKTEYKAGEIFETAGLVVSLTTTTDGEAVTTVLEEGDYTLTIDGQAAATYIFQPTEENQEYTVTVTPKDTTIAPVTFKVIASPVEVAKYGVTIEGLGDMKLDWWYVGGTEWVVDRGEPIEDITTAKFKEGDEIGFSIAADSPSYVKYEDIELEGARLSRTTIGDDEKESFYFTVTTSDVKLIVNNLRSETQYAGKEFVGTYTVYDLSSGTTAHTLVVGADGKVTLDDGTSYEYTYDEATGDFDMEYSSVSLAYSAGAVFYNNKYLGFKDGTISNYLFNSSNDYIAEFSVDGGTKLVYKYYSNLLVEGADFTAEYTGEDLSDFSVLTLTADVDDEGDSCFSIAMGYSSVDRTAVEGKHLLYIVSNGKGGFTREKKDGTQGTYTGAEGELVLDGFKNYTLNGVSGTCTYDESLGIITLDTGKTYKIDTDAMTYEEFELVTSDPWATSTAEFVSEDGTFTFTFSNGKVTFTDSKHSWQDEGTAISYKVSNGKLTFEATYDYWNDEYAEFVLFIDPSLETITVFEDVVAEPLYGWGGTTIMKAGTVFTLVTE